MPTMYMTVYKNKLQVHWDGLEGRNTSHQYWGARQKFWKEPLRGTKILFVGIARIFFHP